MDLIKVRRYHNYRTEEEENDAAVLELLLKQSFPRSKITRLYGSKIEIIEDQIKAYLIVVDKKIFRSGHKDDLADLLEDVIGFLSVPKHNNDILDKAVVFDLKQKFSFFEAYPYENGIHRMYIPNPYSIILSEAYYNIVRLDNFIKVCNRRIYCNDWIYKMILVFSKLNPKEGMGFHIMRFMIDIAISLL